MNPLRDLFPNGDSNPSAPNQENYELIGFLGFFAIACSPFAAMGFLKLLQLAMKALGG